MIGLTLIVGVILLILMLIAPNHLQDQTYVLTSNQDNMMTHREKILLIAITGLGVVFTIMVLIIAR